MPSDACVCLPDHFTHLFYLANRCSSQEMAFQIIPIRFHQGWAELLAAQTVEIESDSISMSDGSCISHGSHVTGDAPCFTTKLALTSAHVTGRSCSLHSLHSAANSSSVCGSLGRRKPCGDFHQTGTHIFCMHIVGHNQGLCHLHTVSLWWIPSLIYHARVLIITVLRGDSTVASFMLTRSNTVRTAARGAGVV